MKSTYRLAALSALTATFLISGCASTVYGLSGTAGLDLIDNNDIQRDVANAIKNNPGISSHNIFSHYDNGVITLSGQLDSSLERSLAANSALQVEGVERVINLLTTP